jgi:hypothetical protein
MIYKLRKDTNISSVAGVTQNTQLNTTASLTGLESHRQINISDSKTQFILHETTTSNGDTKTYQLKSPDVVVGGGILPPAG